VSEQLVSVVCTSLVDSVLQTVLVPCTSVGLMWSVLQIVPVLCTSLVHG